MADGGRVTLRGTRPFILLISRSSSADRNRMPLLNARPLCLATSPLIERARPSLELLLPHSPILPSYWKVDPDAVAYQPRPAIKLLPSFSRRTEAPETSTFCLLSFLLIRCSSCTIVQSELILKPNVHS